MRSTNRFTILLVAALGCPISGAYASSGGGCIFPGEQGSHQKVHAPPELFAELRQDFSLRTPFLICKLDEILPSSDTQLVPAVNIALEKAARSCTARADWRKANSVHLTLRWGLSTIARRAGAKQLDNLRAWAIKREPWMLLKCKVGRPSEKIDINDWITDDAINAIGQLKTDAARSALVELKASQVLASKRAVIDAALTNSRK